MDLRFERPPEIRREACFLASPFYNKLHLLCASSNDDALFIPIRTLQYLAVADVEEVVFVDGRRSRYIGVAWMNFRPQDRDAIDQPVQFERVVYEPLGRDFLTRLQSEFFAAVTDIDAKNSPPNSIAKIIPFVGD